MPREISEWILSAPSRDNYDQGYRPLRRALAQPDNLGAHLNALEWTSTARRSPFASAYTPTDSAPDAPGEPSQREWIARIELHFGQAWLAPFLYSVQSRNPTYTRDSFPANPYSPRYSSPGRSSRAAQFDWLQKQKTESAPLLVLIERGLKREPRNAFWVIERARWEWNYAPRPFYLMPASNFAFAPKINWAALTFPAPSSAASPATGAPATPGTQGVFVPPPAQSSGSPGPAPSLPLVEALGPHRQPLLELNDEPVLKCVLGILEQTRSCSFYQDGNFRAMVAMRKEFNDAGWSCLEMRLAQTETLNWWAYNRWCQRLQSEMWGLSMLNNRAMGGNLPPVRAALIPKSSLARRVLPRQLVQWGATWARIGSLMAQNPALALKRTNVSGYLWTQSGWNLPFPPRIKTRARLGWGTALRLQPFVALCCAQGQGELAREALSVDADFSAGDALWKRANARHFQVAPSLFAYSRDPLEVEGASAFVSPIALWSAPLCEGFGALALFLVPLWLFLNVWLINGKGTPSSTRARFIPAVLAVGVAFTITLLNLRQSLTPNSPLHLWFAPLSFQLPGVTLAALLLLVCAVGTVSRRAKELIHPENDRWHTHFLSRTFRPWVEPVLLASSALILVLSGAFLIASLFHPVLGATPVSPFSLGGLTWGEVGALCLGYGVFMGLFSVGLWLLNWRFAHDKAARLVTHSGLRWWKESVGASICVLAWMYLFVAFAAWPSRNHAKQMLDERWQMGDWVWLQKNL